MNENTIVDFNSAINRSFLQKIEDLGQLYYDYHLKHWPLKDLSNNWWIALKFFFSHSFMRGRRDQLSYEYYIFTISALKQFFGFRKERDFKKIESKKHLLGSNLIREFKKNKKLGRKNSLKHQDFNTIKASNELVRELTSKKEVEIDWDGQRYKKEIFLGNDTDVMMVLDTLAFVVSNKEKMNIYSYVQRKLKSRKVKEVYQELIDSIYGVNDKIVSFFIRDILMLNDNIEITEDNLKYAFPIDTWVLNIARKIKISSNDINRVKESFIKNAINLKLCPLKIAAGLWYLGFNSLEILLSIYLNQNNCITSGCT